MGLGKTDFRTFTPKLYAGVGCLETFTLRRRGDNQNAGQTTDYLIFNVRAGRIYQTGQEIDGTLSSDNTRTIHVPKSELDRVGAGPIRALDQFIDPQGRTWQPESPQVILSKLTEEHYDVPCRRVNNQ